MLFKQDTLDKFYKTTSIDIVAYLQDFSDFVESQAINISNYYGGDAPTPNMDSFNNLNLLIKRGKTISEAFYFNKNSFNSLADWNLLEMIDESIVKLETTSNIGKYLRSSINKNQFSVGIESEYLLREGSTLEKIERSELNSSNPDNDWADLALYNDLIEEDYTPSGGVLLKSIINPIAQSLFLESVLGNLQGENLYGKDIYKVFTFEDNDLKVLSPKSTILQTIQILIDLKRGDNPEFPNDGLQRGLFVGNSIGGLQFPVLFRQLSSVFAKDDTISSFSVTNVKYKEDALFVDYEIQTKYGEIFNITRGAA